MRLSVVLAILLATAVPRAEAQLATAELFVDIDAGAQATDEGPISDAETFTDGPRTTDVFLGSGSIPWDLQAIAGGGKGDADGQVNYLAAASQIILGGTFTIQSAAAAPAAALAGFDAVAKITFEVSAETPYTITGSVSTGRALSEAEVVACQINGTVLAGDSRATTLAPGVYPILREGVAFPGESLAVECSAASSGGTADANTVTFDLQLNLGSTTPTTSTTLQPLTKRQCKKACRRAVAACRASCATLEKAERKTCRRACKQSGRSCGQSTGCALPVG
ncbi:MAG TPA: hypothetical protein VGR62_24475 [Candidatus Binatia bacterium]|jgi:hypothetical protein|nr:hypothetical protein [Candidatus Binatia bacterium]